MSSSSRTAAVSSAFIAVIVATLLIGAAEAQMAPAGAPGPSSSSQMEPALSPGPSEATADCLTVLSDAADCLSFVEAGSTLTVPEKPCCGEMKKVITNRPDCLCQMLAKNNTIGFEFDVKQALKLPSICKVDTPPVSLCSWVSPAGTTGSATTNGHLRGVASLAGAGIALLPFVLEIYD
ncbi:hypothetical protein V2J09_011850 [Rumex salicifolius]